MRWAIDSGAMRARGIIFNKYHFPNIFLSSLNIIILIESFFTNIQISLNSSSVIIIINCYFVVLKNNYCFSKIQLVGQKYRE